MNFVIDVGNSFTKIGVFEKYNLIFAEKYSEFDIKKFQLLINKYKIKKIISSSVKDIDLSFLNSKNLKIISFDEKIKTPFINKYKTPKTLGKDRLAAIAGACEIFPNQNVLVIDAGTAITYDIINENNIYLGGNISLGIDMRYKALNSFTNKLPLKEKSEEFYIIGDSTDSAIISGVQNGIVFEINGYIDYFSQYYNDLKVILTGGNCFFFEKIIKKHIFVNQNLVLIGLNKILEYNA